MTRDFNNGLEIEGEGNQPIEARIDPKNLPFIIDLITRQQYRNPIGSIVREITSNCFDAHIEAGVNDAVVIRFGIDDISGKYIEFIDVGVGMSPERIKDVYLSYGESTKTQTNSQIGGFGLGGKSPLSYTDQFYVTTIYNEVKYEYLVHRGAVLPTIELLYQEEAILERNGTIVRVYFVKENDKYTFIDECKKQLVYFENIVFKPTWEISNYYKIYEGEHFKVRSDANETPYSNQIHLCIGKVAYPINYDNIGRRPIELPIALKFEIGELIVTPERESVRYIEVNGKQTKDIINEKLDKAIEEIKKLYYKQDLSCSDILSYIDCKNSAPHLMIANQLDLNLKEIIKDNGRTCVDLEGYEGAEVLTWDVFESFSFEHVKYRRNAKNKKNVTHLLTSRVIQEKLYVTKTGKVSANKVSYMFDTFLKSELRIGKIEFRGWGILARESRIRRVNLSYKTNRIQQLFILKAAIKKAIEPHIIDVDKIEISKDWLDRFNYRNPKVVRKDDEIVVYDMTEEVIMKRKKFVKMSSFREFTGFVIYGFEENIRLLKNVVELFKESKYNTNVILSMSRAVKIIKIASVNYKYFRDIKHATHVENFIGDNRVFKHFATSLAIREECNYRIGEVVNKKVKFEEVMDLIHPQYTQDYNAIEEYINEYRGRTIDEDFRLSIIDVAKKYNLLNREMYDKHLQLNNYVNRTELLNNLFLTDDIIPYIVDFLVLKGKEVHPIWTNPERYELELIDELTKKVDYTLSHTDYDEDYDEGLDLGILKFIKRQLQTLTNYYNYAKAN